MSFVVNPETNRHVRVGGPTYRRLMRKQLAQEQAREMRENAAQQVVDENEVNDPYENLNYIQPLPNNTKHSVMRKKVPRKKVGKRRIRQQPTQEEVSHYTAASASKVFQNNMGELVDQASNCKSNKDMQKLEDHLQKLILAEMMKKQSGDSADQQREKRRSNMGRSISKSKTIQPLRQQSRYELEEEEEDIQYE